MHYAGTSRVLLLFAALPVAGKWWMIPAMPLAGYGFAWIGHSLIEHNRPATFRYPFWSLRADFVMWFRFLTGRMGRDLKRAGVRPDGSRSEEHTSELQSLMRISYAVFCLKKKKKTTS